MAEEQPRKKVRVAELRVTELTAGQVADAYGMLRGVKRPGGRQSANHIKNKKGSTWRKLEDFPEDDCVTCDYSTDGRGYPQMKVQAVGMLGVRFIVLRHLKPERVPQPTDDASHLCHNKACINPKHLLFENHDLNVSRFCCELFKERFADFKCPHSPTCRGHQPCGQPL